nr:MAG TPA: hypothetical protein [Caudoviricetes sp.]
MHPNWPINESAIFLRLKTRRTTIFSWYPPRKNRTV